MAQYQFRRRGDDTVTATGGPATAAQSSPRHVDPRLASNDLEIIGLGKRYASQQASGGVLQVLDNINLTVPAGQFISIVGASGCGKSTLLRLVLGLDNAFEGQILAGGQPIAGTSRERGIVFQDHRLFPWLTVEQNVGVALRN
ncbi:MAG: ATP-binding cassette domain-containing protein, partial [Advenella sp.]